MLRKVRVDGPPERLDDLLAAARGAAFEVDDWAVDTSTNYGWPSLGNGRAYVLAVVDDDVCSPAAVATAVAESHQRRTGEPAGWVEPGGSFVWLPDGLEPGWYERVGPLAEALHAAEATNSTQRIDELRRRVSHAVAAAIPASELITGAFDRAVVSLTRARSD